MAAAAKTVTVILPTYNRSSILHQCLEALAGQSYPGHLMEVIVVDDGSGDGTAAAAVRRGEELKLAARVLRQEHRGRSAARNLALRQAEGEIVVILADDILASPDLLAEHMRLQSKYADTAGVGYVTWWPGAEITPFMRCLEEGIILSLHNLKDGARLSYRQAYSSNISVPNEIARKILFDEDFTEYGFEDIEWGYRLEQAGIKFIFSRRALGYHHHPMTLNEYRMKMRQAGFSLVRFYAKHPEVERKEFEKADFGHCWSLFLKSHLRGLLLRLLGGRGGRGIEIDPCRCYRSILNYQFYLGISKARRRFLI